METRFSAMSPERWQARDVKRRECCRVAKWKAYMSFVNWYCVFYSVGTSAGWTWKGDSMIMSAFNDTYSSSGSTSNKSDLARAKQWQEDEQFRTRGPTILGSTNANTNIYQYHTCENGLQCRCLEVWMEYIWMVGSWNKESDAVKSCQQ